MGLSQSWVFVFVTAQGLQCNANSNLSVQFYDTLAFCIFKIFLHNSIRLFLANIFSGLILRPPQRKAGVEERIERQKVKSFIENFLTNSFEDWVPI